MPTGDVQAVVMMDAAGVVLLVLVGFKPAAARPAPERRAA